MRPYAAGRAGHGEDPRPQHSAASSEAAFTFGFAHGSAGVIHFLHAYHRFTGDPAAGAAARRDLARLMSHTPRLLELAARPEAHRRYGSWCRGLAGIGTLLIGTGGYEGNTDATDLGVRCARACRALAPRMSPVSQCCGLSGVGEVLLDAAAVTGDDRLHRAAEDVAGLILARSGAPRGGPCSPTTPSPRPDRGGRTAAPVSSPSCAVCATAAARACGRNPLPDATTPKRRGSEWTRSPGRRG